MSPAEPALTDRFGRVATDLRISVTDRCNFRCVYCLPAGGVEWLEKAKLLSFEEMARAARVFVSLGVTRIRLTGGEPTLRRNLPRLVAMLREVDGDLDLAMTTNGFTLESLAQPLAAAGLNRINVSVDSLMAHKFHEITRRDALDQVMKGLSAAEEAGLGPVKLNCVVVRGTNDDEVLDFARLARDTGWEVRFIEFMPLDAQRAWTRDRVVPASEIIQTIGRIFPLEPDVTGGEPARTWRFADGVPGSVGVIASVTEPFCSSCDRLRLTADGQLRTCLFSTTESDLRALFRSGAPDEEISGVIRAAVRVKQAGHLIDRPGFVQPARPMSSIGG
ncbi:MAG: GTP 3',8-cyclase MoaA [Actinomycetota bacterium]